MFRVLFRLIKVCIHIKETLELEFVFKKDSESIVGKDHYNLLNGVSNVNTTTQFLITKIDPSFELHVNFTFKKVKRQAGFIVIDLRQSMQGSSYQQIRKLQNAPGGKALIEFGLIYFDSGVKNLPKSLQSFEAFEKYMNEEYKAEICEQNQVLSQKLKQLTNLKESLIDQKEFYCRMQAEFEKFEAEIDQQQVSQAKKMNEVEQRLKEEEQKQAFLMELVKNSGSEDLINYMKGLQQSNGPNKSQNKITLE